MGWRRRGLFSAVRFSAEQDADKRQRVFGYENMVICGGSVMPANPGVNPSLMITAMSVLVMSRVPPAGSRVTGSR